MTKVFVLAANALESAASSFHCAHAVVVLQQNLDALAQGQISGEAAIAIFALTATTVSIVRQLSRLYARRTLAKKSAAARRALARRPAATALAPMIQPISGAWTD